MRVHRQQLQELVHLYEKNDDAHLAAFDEKMREWRRWILKGYVLEMPGNPPRPLETPEAFDEWARIRFPPRNRA